MDLADFYQKWWKLGARYIPLKRHTRDRPLVKGFNGVDFEGLPASEAVQGLVAQNLNIGIRGSVAASDGRWVVVLDCDDQQAVDMVEKYSPGLDRWSTAHNRAYIGITDYTGLTAVTETAAAKRNCGLLSVRVKGYFQLGPGSEVKVWKKKSPHYSKLRTYGEIVEGTTTVVGTELLERVCTAPDILVSDQKKSTHTAKRPKKSDLAEGGCAEGGRNNALYGWACDLANVDAALNKENALWCLQELNLRYCTPPSEEAEVVRTFESAWKKKRGEADVVRDPCFVYEPFIYCQRTDLERRLKLIDIEVRFDVRSNRIMMRCNGYEPEWVKRQKKITNWIAVNDVANFSSFRNEVHSRTYCFPRVAQGRLRFTQDHILPVERMRHDFRAVANQHRFDPVCEWFDQLIESEGLLTLESDGKDWFKDLWMDSVMTELFEIAEPLDRAAAAMALRMLLLTGVWLAYEPNSRAELLPILCGRGGIGKSLLLELLSIHFPEWHSDKLAMGESESRKTVEALTGKLLVVDEESCASVSIPIAMIKAFLSRTHFRYRKAYAEDEADYQRRQVYAATSNERHILPESVGEEGDRRLIPCWLEGKFPTKAECGEHITKVLNPVGVRRLWLEALSLYHYHKIPCRIPKSFEKQHRELTRSRTLPRLAFETAGTITLEKSAKGMERVHWSD